MANLAATAQPGILESIPSLGRYLTFTMAELETAREALQAAREVIDGRNCVLGIGESLIQALDANIEGLRAFPALVGAGIEIPSTHGALWCWLRGDDRGELLHLTRALTERLSPAFALIDVVDAFKYGVDLPVGRDLTGFEDGTENPHDDAAIAAALCSDKGRGLDGASFVAVQQWIHDLDRFDEFSEDQQEDIVGRRKDDNEELDDAPESAHVKRTAQESFSPEAFVLRRSMPWADDANCGLMFVAYGHSLNAFEAQLRRMAGLEDGITDALFTFTRPVTGNYYWCPPMRNGTLDLSHLGL